MPDGDRIYGKLTQIWERPYEQICEWCLPPEEIAGNLLSALTSQLRSYGLEPILLIVEAAHQLSSIPQDESGKLTANWRAESKKLELLARRFEAKRPIAVTVYACKQYLRQLEDGHCAPDHRLGLIQTYVRMVYKSTFRERLTMGKHRDNVSRETFNERLSQLEDVAVLNELGSIADHIARTEKVKGYRRPSYVLSHVDATTDLIPHQY